jgi:hypothetical protein
MKMARRGNAISAAFSSALMVRLIEVKITVTDFSGSGLGIGGSAALIPMLTNFPKPAMVDIFLTLRTKAYDIRPEEGVEGPLRSYGGWMKIL